MNWFTTLIIVVAGAAVFGTTIGAMIALIQHALRSSHQFGELTEQISSIHGKLVANATRTDRIERYLKEVSRKKTGAAQEAETSNNADPR